MACGFSSLAIAAGLQRELQVVLVLLGQRRHLDGDTGKVDALLLAEHSAVDDLCYHVRALQLQHAQLNQPVGEQNLVARLQVLRQRCEHRAHTLCGPLHLVGSNH